jgi:ribosomal protein S6
LRKYEYLYIFTPQEEEAKKSIGYVKDQYKKMGVTILKEVELGKRRLAYTIGKNTDGFYYTTQIEIDELSKLEDYESELKLNSDVIRFMRVKI